MTERERRADADRFSTAQDAVVVFRASLEHGRELGGPQSQGPRLLAPRSIRLMLRKLCNPA
jgi:hypothetical protein